MTRRIVTRSLLLLVTCVSLYLLAPQLLQVFSSWPKLRGSNPWWLALAVCFEAMSYVALWSLQRIALRTRSWFAVGTSQLAAAAAGSVVPGGGAAASAVQYGILVRAGIPAAAIAGGLTASFLATTATAFALPVIASLAAIGGVAAPRSLRRVAWLGGVAFVLTLAVGVTAFAWNRPLLLLGRGVRKVLGWVGKGEGHEDLPTTLLRQRDAVRTAFAAHPWIALLAAIGKYGFDYLALLCALAAVGARPQPALVLLAYAASALLAMIPLTPGGLGFVEAGLTGLLVLAGVDAAVAAVATLAYRLISFWLPLPVGLGAYVLARRRYGPVPVPSAESTSSSTSEATSLPR
jgi:uncharacterized protein (TIRG00374 family)